MAFGSNSNSVNINLNANIDQFKAGFGQAENVVKGFESVLNKAAGTWAGAMGSLQIPTNFNDVINQSVTAFGAFDEQMRNVNSMMKLNEADFGRFEGMVMSLNDTLHTSVGSAEAAQAAYQAVSHGFSEIGEASQVIGASMTFATASLVEAGAATKLVAGLLESYNLKAEDAAHVTDILTKTIASGSLTGKDLQMTLGRLAPVAHENGISLEEMSSAVAALSDKGIRTNQAVTALVKIIGGLTAESAQAKKTLAEVGLTADQVRESIGENGLVATMRMIENATGGASDKIKDLFGKGPALNAFFALAGKGADSKFDSIFASMKNIDGNAAEAAAEQMKGLNKQVDALKASLEVAGITIGGLFAPMLTNLVGVINAGVNGFTHLGDNVVFFSGGFNEAADSCKKLAIGLSLVVGGTALVATSYAAIASGLFSLVGVTGTFSTLMAGLASVGFPTFVAGGTAAAGAITAMLTPMGLAVVACGAVTAAFLAVAAATYKLNAGTEAIEAMNKSGVNLERQLHALNDAQYRGGKEFKNAREEVEALKSALIDLKKERDKARESANSQSDDLNSFSTGVINTLTFGYYKDVKAAQLDATEEHARQLEKQGEQTSGHLKKSLSVSQVKSDAEKKTEEEQLAARTKRQKDFFNDIDKFNEKVADHEFKTKEETLNAAFKIQQDHQGLMLMAAQDHDEQVLGKFHTLLRDIKKFANEADVENEQTEKKATARKQRQQMDIADSQYKFHKITYEQYIKMLRDQEQQYKDFGDGAAKYEEKIAGVAKTHAGEVKAAKEKALRDYISTTENNLEHDRKIHKINYDQEIAAYTKLMKDKRLADEEHAAERARIANKIGSLTEARDNEAKARAEANNKIESELSKERIKNAEEELAVMKKKVEFGIISESTYTDAVKKTYEMKKAQIELETKAEGDKLKNGTPEQANEIRIRGEMRLRDLQRETAKSYADSINEINKAKQGGINKTEEQIKKEKEYQAIISKQMKGGTMGLDEFVKQSNSQFDSGESGPIHAGQAFGAGGGSAKAAFLKDQKDRLKAMGKLGFDPDKITGINGSVFGGGRGKTISEDDRWMMNQRGTSGTTAHAVGEAALAEAKRQTSLLEKIASNAGKREANAHSVFKQKNDMDGSSGTHSK